MGSFPHRRALAVYLVTLVASLVLVGGPRIALAQSGKDQWDETLPGFKPGHLYDSSGVDNINVFSGDPGISIPIGPAYPLASGLTWQLRAYYSAKYMLTDSVACPFPPFPADGTPAPIHSYVTGYPTLGAGWSLELGFVGPDPTFKRALDMLAYHGPDGGSHSFSALMSDGTNLTVDGSQLRLVVNPPECTQLTKPCYEVDFPDGVRHVFGHLYHRPVVVGSDDFNDEGYRFDSAGNIVPPRDRWGLTAIFDRFHNQVLSVNYDVGEPWKVSSVTLTPLLAAPSSIIFNWTQNAVGSASYPVLWYVTLPTVGGSERVDFTFLPGGSNFGRLNAGSQGCPDATSITVPLLTSIVESAIGVQPPPVPRSYQFTYGTQGTAPPCPNPSLQVSPLEVVTSVTLPTGGVISYEYGPTASRADQDRDPNGQQPTFASTDITYFESRLDETPAVWWRKEFDPTTGFFSFTHYKRRHIGVQDAIHDKRTFREVVVTSLDGNGVLLPNACATQSDAGQVSTRHVFTTPFDSQGGFEVERDYFDRLYNTLAPPYPAPFRTVVRCYEADANGSFQGPLCGWNDPDHAPSTFDLFENVRLQKEVTWYGAPAWLSPSSPGTGGDCSNDPAIPCAQRTLDSATYVPSAYEYGVETITATNGLQSQEGFLSRKTTTTWVGRQTNDPWMLKLFSGRTVEDQGAPTPSAVTSVLDMTTTRGFLSSAYVDDGSRRLKTTYTPDLVTRDPISKKAELTIPSVSTSTFTDTRTFQSGLGLTSIRTGIGWKSFNVMRDNSTGLITSSKDPNGFQTIYSYDALRRLTGISPPGVAPTNLTYSSNTDVTETVSGTDLNGTFAEYRYDGFGRLLREMKKMPGIGNYAVRTHDYSVNGHEKFVSEWGSCTDPASTCLTTSPAGTTYSSFDPFGRATQIQKADGAITTIDFTDGGISFSDTLQSVTTNVNTGTGPGYSPMSATTLTRKDILGRIISVTEPGGDVTSYQYNVLDKLAHVTQGVQTRDFTYDNFGFLTSETHPEKGETDYPLYDALGNALTKLDGGITTQYTYDAAGRLGKVTTGTSTLTDYSRTCYLESTDAECLIGLPQSSNPNGKVLRTVGYNPTLSGTPTVTEDFDYAGPGGRLSTKTISVNAGGLPALTESFYYNSLGLMSGHIHPRPAPPNNLPFAVATEYDQGLPVRQYLNGLQLVKSVTYQPSGGLGSYTTGLGNGFDVTTTIEPDGVIPRPKKIYATLWDGTKPFNLDSYSYDGTGNMSAIGTDTFGYDGRSRLVYAGYSPAASQQFSYDRYGNMTSRTGQSFAMESPTIHNYLDGYHYDRGNLTGPTGTQLYAWDDLDRMKSQALGSWTYVYNAENERIAKQSQAAGWTFTLRDPGKRVSTEFAGSQPSRDNAFLGNLLVVSYANTAVGGNNYSWSFYSSDHLGTPRLVTHIDLPDTESHKYWPYGDEVTPQFAPQRLRFAAMERDDESNRFYDHARHQDFGLARFLSPDPLADTKRRVRTPQGWNRYAYVINNPVMLLDPRGLDFVLAGCSAGDAQKCSQQRQIVIDAAGKDAAQYLQFDAAGKVTLNGISPGGFAKLGVAAHGLAYLISAKDTFTFKTGATVLTDVGGGGSTWHNAIELNPVNFPRSLGNVNVSVTEAFVHELGHAVSQIIPGKARAIEQMTHNPDGIGLPELRQGEGYATAFENQYRRSDLGLSQIRAFYGTPVDYTDPGPYVSVFPQ